MSHQALQEPGPQVRRWREQRWLIDDIIRSVGIEWDQPRLAGLQATLGSEATADLSGIRQRVQKYEDISPAFAAVACLRAAKAEAAEAAGHRVSARDNYFMAASYWASAQWPFDSNDETNILYNERKRECYTRYAKVADHRVEAAWITFGDRVLPGWFHLPSGYAGGRIPLVVLLPGMDGFKERLVALYGDRWLTRGIGVLALEGPGQYESAVLDIRVSIEAWCAVGPAVMNWLLVRPEIDPTCIGIVGSSFGSLFSTIVLAHEPRFRACAVSATCLEPGAVMIFECASPTFKKRFMYMAGFIDESEFDRFCKTLTWEGHVDRILAPYLCVAGEADELSPLTQTDRMMSLLKGPKQLVVYQGARHGIHGCPAANLGPFFPSLIADWMSDRFLAKPFVSCRMYIDKNGGESTMKY